jgi:hypothetical protein
MSKRFALILTALLLRLASAASVVGSFEEEMRLAKRAVDRDARVEHLRRALESRPEDPNNLAIEYRIAVLLSQYYDPEHPLPRRPQEAVEVYEHIVASYRHMDYYSRHPVSGSDDLQFKIPLAAIHLASLDSRPGKARHWSHFAMARMAETFERRQADWRNQPPPPEVREDDPLGGPRERAKWESRMHAWEERQRRAREGDVFSTLEMGVVEQAFRRYRNSFGWLRPSETVVAMGQIVRDFPGAPMARLAQGRIDWARRSMSRAAEESDSASAAAEPAFGIYRLDTGQLVLSDRDIAAYVGAIHEIELNKSGLAKWKSYTADGRWHRPDGLFQKEFAVKIGAKEIYRGRFWSAISSQFCEGVVILDVAFPYGGEPGAIRIEYGYPGALGDGTGDPRSHPEILDFFAGKGILK